MTTFVIFGTVELLRALKNCSQAYKKTIGFFPGLGDFSSKNYYP